MNFMNSYKQLEKLCNEMYADKNGVSVYIDEMEGKPRGAYSVSGWENDLKQLKHYRWVRNKISHEPNCSEENMCERGDELWLDNFYKRIMNGNDPLALYRKAKSVKPAVAKKTSVYQPARSSYTYETRQIRRKNRKKKSLGWIALLVIAALLAVLFLIKRYVY